MKTILFPRKTASVFALLLCLMLLPVHELRSQSTGYRTGIGLRFGSDIGITAKTTLGGGYIEGILGTGYRAFMLTGLYEKYVPAFHRDDFHWYFGAGAHVGFFDRWYRSGYYDNHGYYHYDYVYGYNEPTFGVDGIVGLEYKFQQLPFAASLDLKPFINLYRYDYGFIEGAFSFRYAF